jgi:hypothetical protein
MFSKTACIKLLSLANLLVTVVVPAVTAHADNLNTSGTACRSYNASDSLDIGYRPNGVFNENAAQRWIVCPVARSPLAPTSVPTPTFYVDGENKPGSSTTCTVSVNNYLGIFVASQAFTKSVPANGTELNWDQPVQFATPPSTYDYVTLTCLLPGSDNGMIHGITAVQP